MKAIERELSAIAKGRRDDFNKAISHIASVAISKHGSGILRGEFSKDGYFEKLIDGKTSDEIEEISILLEHDFICKKHLKNGTDESVIISAYSIVEAKNEFEKSLNSDGENDNIEYSKCVY